MNSCYDRRNGRRSRHILDLARDVMTGATVTSATRPSNRILWWLIAAFTVVIPLFISGGGADVFRLPKELLLRAEAILVALVLLSEWVAGKRTARSILPDNLTAVALVAIGFVAIVSTLWSTNRPISMMSLGFFAAVLVVFLGTYIAVETQSLRSAVMIGVASAVLNAILAIVQRLAWWNPLPFENWIPPRMRTTALIGNPNDVGAYLAVCTIAIAAFAVVRRKASAWMVVALLVAGILASDALTGILAATAAAGAMALRRRRSAPITTIALVVVAAGAFAFLPPLRERTKAMVSAIQRRDYDALTSRRIVGFNVAWKIFRDHPVTGAGPGTFKWQYLPYRLRVELEHPEYYLKMPENLGEVHSDHLQVLAEEGLLGYAAFLLGSLAVGFRSWGTRGEGPDDRRRFARIVAFPLTICFLVLAAAGFPLELTAVTTPLLLFAACVLRWSHSASTS